MKKLTNVLAVLSFAVLITPALESCKKGEEDPGLSLRSRKARLVGEWKVSNYTETTTYTQNSSTFIGPSTTSSSSNGTLKVDYDGENFTTENIINSSSGGSTNSKSVAKGDFKYTFEKDGTFTLTQTKVYEETEKEETNTYALETITKYDISLNIKGTWNFVLSVSNDIKNKQYIVLTFTEEENTTKVDKEDKLTIKSSGTTNVTTTSTINSSKSTFETNDISQTWELVRLANKEIKALARGKVSKNTSSSINTTYSNGGNPYQESSILNRIEESVVSLTLER